MTDHWLDWLSLIGRWAHIITAIAWIGSSFFFMWLDSSLRPSSDPHEAGVEGELYMVHSGGYYKVHKKLFAHGNLPKILHWFKWEAAFTWITGIFLLGLIYYSGGSLMMVDDEVKSISASVAIAIGIGTLFISWFFYDFIWRFFGNNKYFAIFLTSALIIAVTYLLTHTLSGRAAYMHVGAMLGTWMVANVWVHIIPNQKRMIEEAQAGKTPNYSLGEQAKHRSIHNNYFTLPVITIMISNHHPVTFGHHHAWIVLALIFLGAAFTRHTFNLRNKEKSFLWPLIPATISFLIAIFMTSPLAIKEENTATDSAVVSSVTPAPATSINEQVAIRNFIKGKIFYNGVAPAKEKLKVPAGCLKNGGQVFNDDIVIGQNKTLQNVIIYIGKGRPEFKSIIDNTEVVIDQQSCTYHPKVVAAMVGQPVVFVNSDSIFHNVKTHTKENTSFNVGMPKKGQRLVRQFDKPEFVIHTKCSVHPWMSAYIGVFDHPWFSVTRENGEYILPGLSRGDYEIIAWHATLGTKTQNVTIEEGEDLNVDFTFDL